MAATEDLDEADLDIDETILEGLAEVESMIRTEISGQ
jgi:hypothetical protein